jgi:hypothetical protein
LLEFSEGFVRRNSEVLDDVVQVGEPGDEHLARQAFFAYL